MKSIKIHINTSVPADEKIKREKKKEKKKVKLIEKDLYLQVS